MRFSSRLQCRPEAHLPPHPRPMPINAVSAQTGLRLAWPYGTLPSGSLHELRCPPPFGDSAPASALPRVNGTVSMLPYGLERFAYPVSSLSCVSWHVQAGTGRHILLACIGKRCMAWHSPTCAAQRPGPMGSCWRPAQAHRSRPRLAAGGQRRAGWSGHPSAQAATAMRSGVQRTYLTALYPTMR